MSQTLTRRQWTAALAAALPAAAAAQAGDTPAQLLDQAKQGVVRNREALAKFKIPMGLEPAARFEA